MQRHNRGALTFAVSLLTFITNQMHTMDTVSQVIARLRAEGYTTDFNLQQINVSDLQPGHPEYVIDKVYRFEGESDPGDEATLYAISSPKSGIKGILLNGSGIYTNELTDDLIESMDIRRLRYKE
jgi:hypothetical protein